MKIIETGFKDLFIIEPPVFEDARGYFFESYNQEKFNSMGISFYPVQDNESQSCRGVIRGLHYQLNPAAQAKLIRVVEGEIFDIALDLRKGSPTFGKTYGTIINSNNKRQFFIPRGFAHGFSVLSNKAIINYKCDNLYSPELERGIRYNDPSLAIDWKIKRDEEIISSKDKNNPLFKDAEMNF